MIVFASPIVALPGWAIVLLVKSATWPRIVQPGAGRAWPVVALALGLFLVAGPAQAQLPRFDPARTLAPGSGASGDEVAPKLVNDGDGNWLAVWSATESLDGRYGRDADLFFSLSHDTGQTWTPARVLNSNANHDVGADVEVVASVGRPGVWVAVWSSDDHPPEVVGTDRDLYFVRSQDGGRTWSKPTTLNTQAAQDWGDDGQPAIASDGKGNWIAVWSSSDTLGATIGGDRDLLISLSADDGKTWSAPKPLDVGADSDDAFDSSPSISSDGDGNWVAVWSAGGTAADGVHPNRGILVSRSTDLGHTWSPLQMISKSQDGSGRQHRGAKLAAGDSGAWVVVWESADTLGGRIGLDRDILCSRSLDEGETWAPPSPLNVNAPRDAGDDAAPAIAYDGNGAWVVAWSTWERLAYALGADADLFVALSEDNGANWTAPLTLNTQARHDYGEDLAVSLATDQRGGWIAAWQSNEPIDGKVRTDFDIMTAEGHFRLTPAVKAP
jgi:hypothetical protein